MANRTLAQFQYSFEKDLVTIHGQVLIGAAGAVTSYQGGGVSAVTKVAATTGQYDIVLEDKYSKFMGAEFTLALASLVNVASVQVFQAPATMQADIIASKTVRIAVADFAGAAVDPTSGTLIQFKLVFRNSSYAPFD